VWKLIARIPDSAWVDATDLPGAQVAETTFTPAGWRHEPLRMIVRRTLYTAAEISANPRARRRKTLHPEQLAMLADGHTGDGYGYGCTLCDIHDQAAVWLEHFHRHRAQIEERLKDAKLGRALRRMPSADQNANRTWMAACLLARNLTAMVCDLCPAAGASGKAPVDAAAPSRQDAAPAAVLRPRARGHQCPPDDPAPARRLPPRRPAQRHLPRRVRTPGTLTGSRRPVDDHSRRSAAFDDPANSAHTPAAGQINRRDPTQTGHDAPAATPLNPRQHRPTHNQALLTDLGLNRVPATGEFDTACGHAVLATRRKARAASVRPGTWPARACGVGCRDTTGKEEPWASRSETASSSSPNPRNDRLTPGP
jgi:hypothetical protein